MHTCRIKCPDRGWGQIFIIDMNWKLDFIITECGTGFMGLLSSYDRIYKCLSFVYYGLSKTFLEPVAYSKNLSL